MIDELMNNIKKYINNHNMAEHEMSTYVEDYIFDNYEKLVDENAKVARYMNDYLADVCEQTEPGLTGTNFDKDLEREYYIIKQMLE